MILQPVTDIAEICARLGLKNVVLSPGSRCAPLVLAFNRHPEMRVKTVSDERAAAFTGLGMAQLTGKASVLVCTSGTAAYNYAPAVAEAFYQQLPLLVLTADRPNEWIDQLDGQTIRQTNLYQNHIKQSFNFPADLSHADAVWYANRLVSEAINLAHTFPYGPVHINLPLREPFYPTPDEVFSYTRDLKIIEEVAAPPQLQEEQLNGLRRELSQYRRVLLVAGQQMPDADLQEAVLTFRRLNPSVLVSDVISNFSGHGAITHQDIFLDARNPATQNLQPDLLITFGKSVISKNLKLFLRRTKNLTHWHLQPAGPVADTFQRLSKIIRCQPVTFFRQMGSVSGFNPDPEFTGNWLRENERTTEYLRAFFREKPFNEFSAYWECLRALPDNCLLQVANSMAVRYVNLIGVPPEKGITVLANRGTSGIDGSTSTAVGNAWATTKSVVLFTGDLAFFYDRNGLWHNYLPPNLRLVVFNNQGGGIFRLIDGPGNVPELEEYFETRQVLEAENTARDFNLTYFRAETEAELLSQLPHFFRNSGAALLEIKTENLANAAVYQAFKNDFESN